MSLQPRVKERDVTPGCAMVLAGGGRRKEDLHSPLCQGISIPVASGHPSWGSW